MDEDVVVLPQRLIAYTDEADIKRVFDTAYTDRQIEDALYWCEVRHGVQCRPKAFRIIKENTDAE